ncbi:cupin domain-containing protein [Nocardioides caldifontis]|uniref:cupin domain-containing protein n=1 Tax=Nocardioides caldifontis TaxID=2588938 RepID=UPI0011E03DB8|nr:cupin domain-containing protein [Nocardioides caldifontis]
MPVVRSGDLAFRQLSGRLSADPLPAGTGGDYSVRVVRIPPGPRTPHLHPHTDEVTFVVSGSGTAWEADTPTPVGPGDLLVVPREVPHATVATGDTELVLLCFFPHPDLGANIVELEGPLRH